MWLCLVGCLLAWRAQGSAGVEAVHLCCTRSPAYFQSSGLHMCAGTGLHGWHGPCTCRHSVHAWAGPSPGQGTQVWGQASPTTADRKFIPRHCGSQGCWIRRQGVKRQPDCNLEAPGAWSAPSIVLCQPALTSQRRQPRRQRSALRLGAQSGLHTSPVCLGRAHTTAAPVWDFKLLP